MARACLHGMLLFMEYVRADHERRALERNIPGPFSLSVSPNGLPALEIHHPSNAARRLLLRMLTADQMGDIDYKLRSETGAFLQGDDNDWMLVEFWQGTPAQHLAFVERLNNLVSNSKT